MKFLDLILLPKSKYEKINDNKVFLIIGCLFVGCMDILFPLSRTSQALLHKPNDVFIHNFIIMGIWIVLLGCIDVFFMIKPIVDFIKYINKDKLKEINTKGAEIKVAKYYIIAHLILFPFYILVELLNKYYDSIKFLGRILDVFVLIIYIIGEWGVLIWFTAILFRGLDTLFKFEKRQKLLFFILLVAWSQMLSYAISFMEKNWIFAFLKSVSVDKFI